MPMAIPLAGAAFGIFEGMAVGGLMGGLMIAGGAATALGTLTGDKDLMKIGAVMGLAGGVGNLASGAASAAGSTADAAREASRFSEQAAQSTSAGAGAAADAAASEAGQALQMAPAIDQTTGLASLPQSVNSPAAAFGQGQPNLVDPGVGQAASGQGGAQAAPAGAGATPASADPYGAGSGWGKDTLSAQGQSPAAQSWGDKAANAFDSTTNWMKNNPEGTKLASGIIQGGMGYYGNQQLAQDNMKRQMAYQDWVRQRYSDSVKNVQIPVLTAPQSSGIIGNARG